MSLGTFLLSAAVTFMIASTCFAGFCDLGPPGTFCLKDLSGYQKCFINKKTSKMEHVIRKCPRGTRCICMGIPCFTSHPCTHYKVPPIMPDSYHTEYNEVKTVCPPYGKCSKTYSRLAFWRDAQNSKYREDRTISNQNPTYESIIILPYHGRWLMKYHVIPSTQSCTKTIVRALPPKIAVPTKFSFHNYRYVKGEFCQRWVWLQGRRNPSQPVNFESWDTAGYDHNTRRVVQYQANFPGSQYSKTSVRIDRYYSVFQTGGSSSLIFQVPRFCNKRH